MSAVTQRVAGLATGYEVEWFRLIICVSHLNRVFNLVAFIVVSLFTSPKNPIPISLPRRPFLFLQEVFCIRFSSLSP